MCPLCADIGPLHSPATPQQVRLHRPPVFVQNPAMHQDPLTDRVASVMSCQIVVVLANQRRDRILARLAPFASWEAKSAASAVNAQSSTRREGMIFRLRAGFR